MNHEAKASLDRALSRHLVKALSDAGTPAVDARDLLDLSIEDLAQGRTVVTWDVDFVDSKRFRVRDHRGVLVVRFSTRLPAEDLARGVVHLLQTQKSQASPKSVVVLEPKPEDSGGRSSLQKPRVAA